MASTIPFKGIHFNQNLISNMDIVIAPPYDIIDSNSQEKLYNKSKYNIIRLEYGEEMPGDNDNNNKYTRSAKYFHRWQREGILQQEQIPCFYWYEQQYTFKHKQFIRSGLFAGVKLEPYNKKVVLPHEETLSKPKADRLQLLKSCQANFSPVFGLFLDEKQEIINICSNIPEKEPFINFTDEQGQAHRLWKFSEPSIIAQIQEFFADKQIFIADGHHRYETALQYSQEMRAKNKSGYDHVLMALTNLYDPGLLILPTHRVIHNLKNLNIDTALSLIQRDFDIQILHNKENITDILRLKGKNKTVFGMYMGNSKCFLLTEKKAPAEYNQHTALDVVILQELILERVFGIGSSKLKEGNNLLYAKDEIEAIKFVNEGKAQIAFLLNPPKVEQVVKIARSGEKMPQKSTFFFPKLVTGLVILPYKSYN